MNDSISPKRLIVYLIIFIVCTALALWVRKTIDPFKTTPKVEGDGRPAVKLGMSSKEVKKLTGFRLPMQVGDMLMYRNKTLPCIEHIVKSDYKCSIVYEFYDDELYTEYYRMATKKVDSVDFMMDYFEIQSVLTKLYGEPYDDESIWIKKPIASERDSFTLEKAVLNEQLRFRTTWFLEDDTGVELVMEYAYGEIIILITYNL